MLPLIVADICGIVFIEYGYQLTMTCIEMTIIELTLLILIIFEKIQLKRSLLNEQKIYKVDPKLLDSQKVMAFSGNEGANGDLSFGPSYASS